MKIVSTGQILKNIRKKYNFSQKEVAYGIIDSSYLSHIESGRKLTDFKTLSLLIDRINELAKLNGFSFKLNKKYLLLTKEERIRKIFQNLLIKIKTTSSLSKVKCTYENFSKSFSPLQNSVFLHKLILLLYKNQNWEECQYYNKRFFTFVTKDSKYFFRLGQVLTIETISILCYGRYYRYEEMEYLIISNTENFEKEILEKLLINTMNLIISKEVYKKNLFYLNIFESLFKGSCFEKEKEILKAQTFSGLKKHDESIKLYKKILRTNKDSETQIICNNNLMYLLKDISKREKVVYRYNISKRLIQMDCISERRKKESYYSLGEIAHYLNRKKDSFLYFKSYLKIHIDSSLCNYQISRDITAVKTLLLLVSKKDVRTILFIKNKIILINRKKPSPKLNAEFIVYLNNHKLSKISHKFLIELQN